MNNLKWLINRLHRHYLYLLKIIENPFRKKP